jgi:glutaredoxin
MIANRAMANVILYSKSDCPLCDEARTALERVRARVPFELGEVDITTDPELDARYRERIPIVAVDGEELFDFHVDEHALERRLAHGALAG